MLNFEYSLSEIMVSITTLAFALLRLLPSAIKITQSVQSLRFSEPSLDKLIEDLFKLKLFPKKKKKFLEFNKEIEFKNLSFSYSKQSRLVFDNLNLKINKNNSYLVIGESGAGKSTFANLISGLIDDYKGKIYLDKN